MRRSPAVRKPTTTKSSSTSATRPMPQQSRVTGSPTAKPAVEGGTCSSRVKGLVARVRPGGRGRRGTPPVCGIRGLSTTTVGSRVGRVEDGAAGDREGGVTTTPLRPWAAPEITAWNRLPMHAVPHRDGDLGVDRLPLDGTWRFELFPTPEPAMAAVDLAARLTVPGAWTLQEFDDVHGVGDLPHYTNVQMPWPGRPPHPPADRNPTGVHERDVEIPASWAGRRIVLHVGAAESVLLAAVNGVDVGIGKDSHLASEFDVTEHVRPGESNVVRLTVVKWSDATYIEDQDEWWHGGITRPVFLYATAPVHLADVHVTADLDGPVVAPLLEGATATGSLRVDVHVGAPANDVPDGWTVRIRLTGGPDVEESVPVPPSGPVDSPGQRRGSPLTAVEAGRIQYLRAAGAELDPTEAAIGAAVEQARRPLGMGRLRFETTAPGITPWTAELPQLYDLEVTLHGPDGGAVERAT